MAHHFLVFLFALSIAFSFAILIMAIYIRQAPRSLYFSYMALAIFIFTVGYFMEITSPTLESAIIATQIQYLGVPFIAPLLLLFIVEYCGLQVSKLQITALLFIPVSALLMVLTWPWNGLFYHEMVFVTFTVVPHLIVAGSIFYYIFFAYTYSVTLVAIVIALYYYRKGDKVFRKRFSALVIGTMLPAVGNLINVLRVNLFEIDITAILLSVSCMVLGYTIFRLGLYRIAPIAREQIVETMSDGFILIDMQGMFIDANTAAKNLIPQLKTVSVGRKLSDLGDIPWLNRKTDLHKSEFSIINENGAHKFYRTSETIIHYKGKSICSCIMIYDITEAKQLLDELSVLAEQDGLTGLINRGTLYKKGESLFCEIAEERREACCFMMDLDFFKKVNDTYGHLKGDEVLKTIAEKLMVRFRNTDLFARYGGEELCAFLPDVNETDAIAIAENLRKIVEQLEFSSENGIFNITISIGVSIYRAERHRTFETFVQDADTALYAAKKAGRNCVIVYKDPSIE